MEVQFNDLNADVDSAQAIEFLSTWFEPGDLINVTCIRASKSNNQNIVTQSETLEELVNVIKTDDNALRNVVWTPEKGIEWNVYIGVCPTKRKPKSIFRRGGLEIVDHVPGLWSDIDIKEGGFSSQEEILAWVDTIGCRPTMIVDSGSGGVHLYWKYAPSTVYKDDFAPEAWWAYLDYIAGENRSIDKIQDLSRILRLPGTIRFAKVPGDNDHAVRIIENTGLTYDQRELRKFAEPFYEMKKALMKEHAVKEEELSISIEDFNFKSNWEFGNSVLKKAMLENKIVEEYSWTDILEPQGWTINKQLRDGSIEWTRPGEGASGRSAVTDWEDSPHVMSLLSTDPHTRLEDLKDLGVPLTKMRVMLRLWYDDRVEKMMEGVYNEETRRKI